MYVPSHTNDGTALEQRNVNWLGLAWEKIVFPDDITSTTYRCKYDLRTTQTPAVSIAALHSLFDGEPKRKRTPDSFGLANKFNEASIASFKPADSSVWQTTTYLISISGLINPLSIRQMMVQSS